MMRVVLLTQDEPLFLVPSIEYLLSRKPDQVEVAGCVVFDPSPLGKKAGTVGRARELLRVFGPAYFLHYGAKFAAARLKPSRRLSTVLRRFAVPELRLKQNVNAPESLAPIRALQPDLLISVAANQIFRRALIEIAPKGCLNLHSALLPKYRGLMPTFWVLKNGEKETGVSVFLVDEGIDSGPIVVQKRVPIETNSLEELIRRTKVVGMDAVWEAVEKIASRKSTLIPNPESEKTYFSFPTKADVRAFRAAGKRLY
jgi:methionyl-tRNA formyltransferase